jgi:hypothetical protein
MRRLNNVGRPFQGRRRVFSGAQIASVPITYQVDGKQYVSVVSGLSLVTFALRE